MVRFVEHNAPEQPRQLGMLPHSLNRANGDGLDITFAAADRPGIDAKPPPRGLFGLLQQVRRVNQDK
jgi:hypothetical protein